MAGECAAEYLALYQKLIKPARWKVYLAARGVLPYVGNLITKVRSPGLGEGGGCTLQLHFEPAKPPRCFGPGVDPPGGWLGTVPRWPIQQGQRPGMMGDGSLARAGKATAWS